MRFSLVALVPAIGLCLSKAIEGRIHPRHNDAFKGDSKSICVTYVNTYLSTLEPRGSTNTELPELPPPLPARSAGDNQPQPLYTLPPPNPYGGQPQPPPPSYGNPPPNPYDPQYPPTNPWWPYYPPPGNPWWGPQYPPQPPSPPPGYGEPPGPTTPVLPPVDSAVSSETSASTPPGGSPSTGPPTPGRYIVNVEALVPQIVPQPAVGKRRDIDPRAVIGPALMTNIGFISNNEVTFSCSFAAPYYTFNGQLLEAATGLPLSVNAGVPFINLTIAAQGSISTRFEIVDEVLHWYNPQFFGGEAIFCVWRASGILSCVVTSTGFFSVSPTGVNWESLSSVSFGRSYEWTTWCPIVDTKSSCALDGVSHAPVSLSDVAPSPSASGANPIQTVIAGSNFNIPLIPYLNNPLDEISSITTNPNTAFLNNVDQVLKVLSGTVPVTVIPTTLEVTVSAAGLLGEVYTKTFQVVVLEAQRIYAGQAFNIPLLDYLGSATDTITDISTDPATPFLDTVLDAATKQISGTAPLDAVTGLVEVTLSVLGAAGPYTKLLHIVVVPTNIITIGQPFLIELSQYLTNPADTINSLVSVPSLLNFIQDDLDIAKRQIVGIVPLTAIQGSFSVSLSVTGQLGVPYLQLFYVIIISGSSSSSSILPNYRECVYIRRKHFGYHDSVRVL
ncbi:hypothetical protein F5883DRAFT_641571 [Diaporthe sp. PMI_573]|nr:hypothetical protein F5883DRAFT_641571 [Diaporthaceae sp. PMI_573]